VILALEPHGGAPEVCLWTFSASSVGQAYQGGSHLWGWRRRDRGRTAQEHGINCPKKKLDDMTKKVPKGLSREARTLWKGVVNTWTMDEPGLVLLEMACRSLDRRRDAELTLAEEGAVQIDRFGQRKPHPCVGIIRDEVTSFCRCMKALGLDVAGAAAKGEPPL